MNNESFKNASTLKELGDFTIKDYCIGEGSFSRVMLAIKNQTKTLYAVKIIPNDIIKENKETIGKLILNENILSKFDFILNHDFNIRSSKFLYMFYPWIPLGSAANAIKSKKIIMDEYISSLIFKFLISSIAELHKNNFLHLDLSSEHIFLKFDKSQKVLMEIKIGGLSFVSRNTSQSPIQKISKLSQNYPELSNPDYSIQPSIDLWGIGATVYELIFGEKVNMNDYQSKIQGLSYSKIFKHNLLRCLSTNPLERKPIDDLVCNFNSTSMLIEIDVENIEFRKSMDPYKELETIGEGGFAIIKKASKNNEIYAIKIIEMESLPSKKVRDRLIHEISLLKELSGCPYIVKMFDVFYFNQKLHIVLEYCNGGSLLNILEKIINKTKLPITEEEGYVIGYNFASALNILHSKSYIHRDVKPDNLLIITDKNNKIVGAKLGDFGLSKKMTNDLTQSMVGTKTCMAPEQLITSLIVEGYNKKVDVWAYGLALFNIIYLRDFYIYKSNYSNAINLTNNFSFPEEIIQCTNLIPIMKKCIKVESPERPTFEQILEMDYFKASKFPVVEAPKHKIDGMKKIRGSYSTVYSDNINNQAIKIFEVFNNENNNNIEKFIPEYKLQRMMKGLLFGKDCPFIAKLLDYYLYGKSFYVIQELYNKTDIKSYMEVLKQPFTENQIKIAGMHIGTALKYLIDKEIIHRNICPSNILLEIKEQNKIDEMKFILSGFSSCRSIGKIEDSKSIETDSTIGLDFFIPPEKNLKNELSKKYDVWSLGLTLLTMLTNNQFIKSSNYNSIYKIYCSEQKIDIPKNLKMSKELRELLLKTLCRKETRVNIYEFLELPFFK